MGSREVDLGLGSVQGRRVSERAQGDRKAERLEGWLGVD